MPLVLRPTQRPRAVRRAVALALLAAAVALATHGATETTTPPFGLRDESPTLKAFVHATIVVSPQQTITDGTLIIEHGRVRQVGAGLAAPAGAEVFDLRGHTIYPGFLDPYTDYGLPRDEQGDEGGQGGGQPGNAPQYEGDRSGAGPWNEAIHAHHAWIDSFEPDEETAEPFLQRGVTAVQSARLDGVFQGRAFVASLAQVAPNEAAIRPRSLHFASFDKGSSRQEYPSSLMGSIALVRQTLLDADWYQRAWAAYEQNPAQRAPEVNRALEALAGNTDPIVFATDDELSLLRAGRIGAEFSQPLIHLGSQYEYNRIDNITALGQPIILPLTFPVTPEVGSYEAELDVTLADLRHWERAPSNPAALERQSVPFAFTGHGLEDEEDFLDNLRLTVRRGLTAETALAALTTVPARLCGVEAELGTLEAGKRGHFFITDGDLLQEEAEILSVWIDGAIALESRSLDAIDFRGRYRLTVADGTYDLAIEGEFEAEGMEGTLSRRGADLELEGIEILLDRLHFQAPLDDAGHSRFTLYQVGDDWQGRIVFPDGRTQPLTVARSGAADPAEEEASEEEGPLLSRLTKPNMAFGNEALPQREDVLIRNATLWTNESDGNIEQGDLLIVDGKIAAIGTGLSAPSGARVIDAAGKHVTPGIIDEHSHLAISQGVNEASHAVTAEVRIGDVVNPDDIGVYRALAGGVTAAQLLHGSANPIGGQAQVIKMRWGHGPEAMKVADAPPTIKFALGENVKQSNWGDNNTTRYPQTRMGVETIIRDSFRAARAYGEAHQAHQGRGAGTVPPRRDLQLETLLEILNSERFLHVHSYVQSEILMLMRLAESFGFHVQTFTHILEGYKVAPEMAAHGAMASTFADWWAYKFEVYDAIPYNTCLLHKHGVVTSVNSDSSDLIRRLNQDAAKSVLYCDMPETEALKLVTLNPAIQLKIDDRVGSLAVGKDADIVIWNGHPLSVYTKAEQTWVDGTLYFSLERDAAQRQANREEKQALVQKALRSERRGGGEGYGMRKNERLWDCSDVEDVWHAKKR